LGIEGRDEGLTKKTERGIKMKNMADVATQVNLELIHYRQQQAKNIYDDYYLYYMEATPEHDGGLIICKNQPPNPDYKLAMPERIGKHLSSEQQRIKIINICRTLPILS
jgi:hypothetical protein